METAANMIPLIVASFLSDIGINSILTSIATISPSVTTLKSIIMNEAVDTILLEKRKMRGITLTLICDKGEGEQKEEAPLS